MRTKLRQLTLISVGHAKLILLGVVPILSASAAPVQADKFLTEDASRGQLFELLRSYLQAEAPAAGRQLYAFPSTFKFPHDALWKNPVFESQTRNDQLFGIDLSHHNAEKCHCQIDWALLSSQKVHFAYLKASQGVQGADQYFDSYRQAARSLPSNSKIHVGPYHFMSADGTGEAQAAHFLAVIAHKLAPDDLPPTLDLEWDVRIGSDRKLILGKDGKAYDFWTPMTGDEILSRAVAWLDVVAKATSRTPIVYTNRVWWHQRIGDEAKIGKLGRPPVWIADYSISGLALESPSVPNNAAWMVWQFTANASFTSGGIGTGQTVDASVFNGTPEEFRKALGVAQ